MVSIVLVTFADFHSDLQQVRLVLPPANYLYVVPVIVFVLAYFLIRPQRRGSLVAPVKRIPRLGFMANMLLSKFAERPRIR